MITIIPTNGNSFMSAPANVPNTHYSGARASHLWRDPICSRPAWWGADDNEEEKDDKRDDAWWGAGDDDDEQDGVRYDDDVDEVLWYLLVSRLALDGDVDLNHFQVSRKLFPLTFLATSACYW